jgi:D-proline reductase (dithiol) PrdB
MIEEAGIPTTSISLLMEVTEKVKPPRVLFVDKPLGYPLGDPFDKVEQTKILKETLQLLEINTLPVVRDYIG